jgi:hypothetical protein
MKRCDIWFFLVTFTDMSSNRTLLAGLILLTGLSPVLGQQFYPYRLSGSWLRSTPPYSSVGLIYSKVGRYSFTGSGAVAQDKRLMYGCAHVIYDRGKWASSVRFARGYSSYYAPKSRNFTAARGFHYLSGYTPNWYDDFFEADFAVAYKGNSGSFGPPLGWYTSSQEDLTDGSKTKTILGYPAKVDYTGRTGRYYMHQTGSFYRALEQIYLDYYDVPYVSTGPGNSGGPVLMSDDEGYWYIAGILVSGNRQHAGVYALNPVADELAQRALSSSSEGMVRTRRAMGWSRIPDAKKKYSFRTMDFSSGPTTNDGTVSGRSLGMPPSIRVVSCSMEIYARQGDIDAYVRSPRGRIQYVAQRGNPESELVFVERDLTSRFSGTTARGKWRLYFRDMVRGGGSSYFGSAALAITSRWSD